MAHAFLNNKSNKSARTAITTYDVAEDLWKRAFIRLNRWIQEEAVCVSRGGEREEGRWRQRQGGNALQGSLNRPRSNRGGRCGGQGE